MSKRDKQWLEWVRDQKCAECGRYGPSEPHHFKGDLHLSGVGMKSPDYLTMPLCLECHLLFHSSPWSTWREDQRGWMIRTFIKAFDDGMIERKAEQ